MKQEKSCLITSKNISRRTVLQGLGIAGVFALAAPVASFGVTKDQISKAKQDYAQAQEKLTDIANQAAQKNEELAQTVANISSVNQDIQQVNNDIAQSEARLKTRQQVLGKRVAQAYKTGGSSFLSLLLQSSSFEEFSSNMYYFEKIAENDKKLIDEVQESKHQLKTKKQLKQKQMIALEELKEKQKKDFAEIAAKEKEAQDFVNSLSGEVKKLVAERDAELAAAQKAAREEAERRKKAQSSSGSKGSQGSSSSSSVVTSGGSGSLSKLLSACRSVGSPGLGLCAMWVSQVFSRAGFGYPGGNANDMYASWCHSSNMSQLKPGMIIAVSTHPHTLMGRIYGHIGIYVGGGMVMDNIGYIRTSSVNSWISYYGATVPARWGWMFGKKLS